MDFDTSNAKRMKKIPIDPAAQPWTLNGLMSACDPLGICPSAFPRAQWPFLGRSKYKNPAEVCCMSDCKSGQ